MAHDYVNSYLCDCVTHLFGEFTYKECMEQIIFVTKDHLKHFSSNANRHFPAKYKQCVYINIVHVSSCLKVYAVAKQYGLMPAGYNNQATENWGTDMGAQTDSISKHPIKDAPKNDSNTAYEDECKSDSDSDDDDDEEEYRRDTYVDQIMKRAYILQHGDLDFGEIDLVKQAMVQRENVKQRLDSISGSNDSSSGDVWCHDLAYYKDITARYFDWDSIQTNVRSKRKKFVINPTFKKMVMELRERKRTDPKTYIKATREMEAIRKKVKSKRKQSNTESKRSRQRNDSDSDEPPAKRCRTNKNKTIARTNKKKTKSRKNKSKSMVDLSSGDDA
eukprot:889194_1